MKCDYCNKNVELVNGEKIYPHRADLINKYFYYCDACSAYVGCHPGTKIPLGRLANKELRKWKRKTHDLLDPIWKNKKMSRKETYLWLSRELNIDPSKCHIGMFDINRCKQAINIILTTIRK